MSSRIMILALILVTLSEARMTGTGRVLQTPGNSFAVRVFFDYIINQSAGSTEPTRCAVLLEPGSG